MGKTSFNRLNHKIKSWRIGDYFRQFSIVAAGIIVTFWGNDRITENARQKEVRATMQLITEELEYNKQELRNIKHLLDIDIHMSLLLKEHDMDVYKIPTDTLWKYGKLFSSAKSGHIDLLWRGRWQNRATSRSERREDSSVTKYRVQKYDT